MRTRRIAISALAVAVLVAPAALLARQVFLNGVDISHLKNKTFEGATVHIDADGDIHLDAPGYEVKVVDDTPGADKEPDQVAREDGGANPLLRNRYFLATQPSPQGRAQFDFVVSVNGVERKRIEAGSPPVILEVSAWFQKGKNTVEVRAIKDLEGGRKSTSESDAALLLLGSGHEEEKVVKMDVVHVRFEANAAQLVERSEKYTVNAL